MTQALEERLAHLVRAVDDLSEVVARHDQTIDRLARQIVWLLEREREREAQGSAPAADERPPHW